MATFAALQEPPLKRAEFGEVSLALFWLKLNGIKATDLDNGKIELEITSIVPDRDTAQFLKISFKVKVPGEEWRVPAKRAAWLRFVMLKWLAHELDEHLFLNGTRAVDPHESRQPAVDYGMSSTWFL